MEELKEEIKGVFVTPVGDFNCQSFPINDDFKYFLTDEEKELLGKHLLKWGVGYEKVKEPILDDEGNVKGFKEVKKEVPILVENDNSKELEIKEAHIELAEIKKWFIDNDWKPNKIITGEWSTDDERWTSYLEERTIKRARQDELNEIIKLNVNNNTNSEEEVEEA